MALGTLSGDSSGATAGPAASVAVDSRPPDFREPGSAPRWRVGVGAAVVALLVVLGAAVALNAVSGARGSTVASQPRGEGASGFGGSSSASVSTPVSSASLFVHILGRVAKPGLYEVPAGSRAVDVVTAAGGFAPDADEASLNLARTVADGEQIVVPAVGEAPATGGGAAARGAGAETPSRAAVDLNSADQAALETLPGVGPATATAILAWRDEHGRFASIDDLLDVRGIGAAKLEAIRDSVVVR